MEKNQLIVGEMGDVDGFGCVTVTLRSVSFWPTRTKTTGTVANDLNCC